jgi:hypothetical protein
MRNLWRRVRKAWHRFWFGPDQVVEHISQSTLRYGPDDDG